MKEKVGARVLEAEGWVCVLGVSVCILERKGAEPLLEFKPHPSPLLPPCLYSVGVSGSKKDRERRMNHIEAVKDKGADKTHRLTLPAQVTFMLWFAPA